MLKILNNSLDGIILGQKLEDINKEIINNTNYSLEFDNKCKVKSDSRLITISSSVECDSFSLNGKVISFTNLEKFLEEENPFVEISDEKNYFYTFPKYNLSLYVDYENKSFLQILIYDNSLKELYESKRQKYLDFEKENTNKVIVSPEEYIFFPYKYIGKFKFNSSLMDVVKKHNISNNIKLDKKNIIEVGNFVLRFDDGKLTQVTIFCNEKIKPTIFYDGINISSTEGVTELLSKYDVIERTASKYLFKDLGLVIEKDLSEFRFFAQSLLRFWANLHRPITSW